MAKTLSLAVICAGLLVAWAIPSFADDKLASPADGKAMLERAIAALRADEPAALKAFNDEKNKDFRDRDLYVFCFSLPAGNITAYQSPVMLGTNVKDLKLPPNYAVGQHAYDAAEKLPRARLLLLPTSFRNPVPKS